MGKEKMRIVVFTCDSHSWLIPTFLHFYKKNWPDNPYQTDFVTETKKIGGISTFLTGKIPWADGVIKYLKSHDENLLLLLLEDYILSKTIDTNRIKQAEDLCSGDIGCVRLYDKGIKDFNILRNFLIDIGIEGFKEYPPYNPYTISLMPTIWQKGFLLEFLREGENPWQTELDGSARVQKPSKRTIWADIPIISYRDPPFGYIKRGRIRKSTEQWAKENW